MKIAIGKIINTHGLKGEVKIESWSDFDDIRYRKGKHLVLSLGDVQMPVTVRSYRKHKGFPLVSFEELADLTAVEPYRNFEVLMDERDRHELAQGRFYVDEIIGMTVQDESGTLIGTVVSVEKVSEKQNNFRIRREDGKEILIPNVPSFVRSISKDTGMITVHVIEGLL